MIVEMKRITKAILKTTWKIKKAIMMSNMLHKPIYERYETSNIKDTKKQKSRIFQNILVNSSANRKAKCLKGLNLKLKLDVA